ARKEKSTYVLMYPSHDRLGEKRLQLLKEWEAGMIKAYQDDSRKLKGQDDDQDMYDESEELRVEKTQAVLTHESAIPHLHPSSAVIPHSQYVDMRPYYYNQKDGDLWTCELTLPIAIPPELRKYRAKHMWKAEKMAERDAAFQAYINLYKNGLIDDN